MYIISTRDCFVYDVNSKESVIALDINFNNTLNKQIESKPRNITRREYFFEKDNYPSNLNKFIENGREFRVGVVTYDNFFSDEELKQIERNIEITEEESLNDLFLQETAQKTFSGQKIKRTKFFFGSRYMWTKKQLAEPNSYVGAGIRKDVSHPPNWMKDLVESKFVASGLIKNDFINSYALNVYHDGSEGLAQHFDDAVRFKQVILQFN